MCITLESYLRRSFSEIAWAVPRYVQNISDMKRREKLPAKWDAPDGNFLRPIRRMGMQDVSLGRRFQTGRRVATLTGGPASETDQKC